MSNWPLKIATTVLLGLVLPVQLRPQLENLHETFQNPPPEARPLMRWWWFGPAVTKPELQKELETMQKAGIGGVEIQPVYPLMLDAPARDIRNLKYLSPEFLDAVTFANRTATSLGMRVDITLGSGWPYLGHELHHHSPATRRRRNFHRCLRSQRHTQNLRPIPSETNRSTLDHDSPVVHSTNRPLLHLQPHPTGCKARRLRSRGLRPRPLLPSRH